MNTTQTRRASAGVCIDCERVPLWTAYRCIYCANRQAMQADRRYDQKRKTTRAQKDTI